MAPNLDISPTRVLGGPTDPGSALPAGAGTPSDSNFAPPPEAVMGNSLKPAVVDGVDQLPTGLRFANQAFFGADPQASGNYLRSRGYEPPPGGYHGGSFGSGGILDNVKEAGGTVMDALTSSPRMIAMGLGATAGGIPGAAAGDAAASQTLSDFGSKMAGIEPTEQGTGALGGAMEGGIAQATGNLLKNGTALFADAINIPQGVAALKNLFKISPETVGRDIADSAAMKLEGFAHPNDLGLDNGIDKVLTDPQILSIMKGSQSTPGNTLANLSVKTQEAKLAAGQDLSGITDKAGNLIKEGVVSKVDSLPNSAIPYDKFQAESDSMIHETLQQMNLVDDMGKPLIQKAADIKSALEYQRQVFKDGQTGPAKQVGDKILDKITLINEGAGGQAVGLKALKEELHLYPERADKLTPQISALQKELDTATADYLSAEASVANPKIGFAKLDDHGTALGKIANFEKQGGKPEVAEALKLYYGKFATYLKAHAMALDPAKAGPEYLAAKERYSVLSDFEKIIPRAVGEASMMSPAELPGLAPTKMEIAQKIAKIPGKVAAVTGLKPSALPQANNLTANALFSRALRKLPDVPDTGAAFRGNMLSNWAAEKGGEATNAAATIFGRPLSRQVGSLFAATISAAGAQEPDLNSLKDGMTLTTLIDSGMAPPDSKQSGFDISQVPPEQMMSVNQQVMGALQPLNDAIKFGSEDEVGAAYSQVAKQFPELFPAPKTGIKGEVVDSQGNVKLYDPTDRARYATQIQVDSGMGWDEKAKVISEMNSTFTILNPKKPK